MGHVADRRTANVKERWHFSYVVSSRRLLVPSVAIDTRPDVAADSDRRVNVSKARPGDVLAAHSVDPWREQTDGSATGPLAGRLLEQPRALSVDDCLDR